MLALIVWPGMTDRPASSCDNFGTLRLFAVLVVVYGNGWVLSGGPGPGLWGAPFARIGVDLLFAISGFLAVESWERAPVLDRFVVRRFLRIFPGLIACVLATLFVIGPLATSLSLRFYLLNKLTLKYLANVLLYPELWLPGVFRGQEWNGAVNPMIWTLAPGLLCCLSLAAFGRLPRPPRIVALAGSTAISAVTYWAIPADMVWPNVAKALPEIPFFLIGALLRTLEGRLGDELRRADLAMLCFAGNWLVATWLDQWNIVLEWMSLPYMAMCFGRMATPPFSWVGRLGNPSYGLFLFAFPIQQLVLARLPGLDYPVLTAMALAVPVGFLSWHLVERPALRLTEPTLGLLRRRAAAALGAVW